MRVFLFVLLSSAIVISACGSFDTARTSSAMVHTPEGIYTVSPNGGTIYCFKFNQTGELFYETSFTVDEAELQELMETAPSCTVAVGDTLKKIMKFRHLDFSPSEMIFTGSEAYTVSSDRRTLFCFRYDEEGKLAFYKSVRAE